MIRIVATLLMAAAPAIASERAPSAECDAERKSVRIVMEPEMAALRPAIYLDGEERALEVRQWSAGAAVARLHRPLGDGVYRIRLRHGASQAAVVEVPLVVGVVGPVIVE